MSNSGMLAMIDPLDLNRPYFVDALIYGIAFDSVSQTVTITLEADAAFHEGVKRLLPESQGNVLIDVVVTGVQSAEVERIPRRHSSWAADEKPHDWEIAEWRVSAARFRSNRYILNVQCWEGQKIRVVFEQVTVNASRRQLAVVHDYA
jgi:hypothetical protein